MLKHVTLSIALVVAMMAIAVEAKADSITGGISFMGKASPTGGTDWSTATGVHFKSAFAVDGTGDYSGIDMEPATFADFVYDPVLSPNPVHLWTFDSGLTTYSFDLSSLTSVVKAGSAAASRRQRTGNASYLWPGRHGRNLRILRKQRQRLIQLLGIRWSNVRAGTGFRAPAGNGPVGYRVDGPTPQQTSETAVLVPPIASRRPAVTSTLRRAPQKGALSFLGFVHFVTLSKLGKKPPCYNAPHGNRGFAKTALRRDRGSV